jgi:hypothetical protein
MARFWDWAAIAEPESIIFWNFAYFFCSMASDINAEMSASDISGSGSDVSRGTFVA